uniref:Uncharacterized protein n=1 Tax=Tetranychus urticae TaxID=32264 RepID=T1K1R6_TETUR
MRIWFHLVLLPVLLLVILFSETFTCWAIDAQY